MANLETLELTISSNAESAKQGIDNLATSLSSLSDAIIKPYSDLRDFNVELTKMRDLCKGIKLPNLGRVTGASSVVSRAKKHSYDDIRAWQKEAEATRTYTNNLGTGNMIPDSEMKKIRPEWYTTQQERIGNAMRTAKENAGGVASWAEETKDATKAVEGITQTAKESGEESKKTALVLEKLKGGFKDITKGASTFFSRVKRIATTMLIRAAIRGLIRSIREGINNLYEWSKLNNGEFAKSLDTLKAKSQQLKNSIGASIAPVIQAAIPVLQSLANAAVNAFNWVNQLFSLLTGKSYWVRATEGAEDYADAAGKAGGATKSWLAAFDELNVMTSGGGGGGGSTAADYADMFENVTAFDSKIREIAEFLKENFEAIKDLAILTGTTMLAWKLGSSFAESLPLLSQILGYAATIGTIGITIGLTWLFGNQFLQTGEDGWLWAEGLTAALGATAAWYIAKQLIGGKAGMYAAAITLAFSAVTGIIANITNTDVDAFSPESIKQSLIDALKMGAAAGIMLVPAVGAGAGLITALGAAIVTFAVSVGLKIVTQKKNISVDPNLITLTEEECKAFVKSKMFTIDPDIMISVTKDTLTKVEVSETELKESISSIIGTLHVIKLGLANDNDYAYIKDQITGDGGLISKINGWINSAETLSQLVLKFTPKLVGTTSEEQSEWYANNIDGWETVKKFANDLGKQLTDEIVKGENDELIIKRPDRVKAILDEISRISNIIAGSDTAVEAQIDFELKLQNLDSSSFNTVLEEYKNYKEQMKEAANEIVKTAEANQIRLVKALELMLELDPNNAEIRQQLEEARSGLETIRNNYQGIVDETMKDLTDPGRTLLQEWVEKNFDPGSVNIGWTDETYEQMLYGENGLITTLKSIFNANNIDTTLIDINELLEVGGWDLLSDDVKAKIIKTLGGIDYKNLPNLKKKGVPATLVLELSDWDGVVTEAQKDFINAMYDAYGTSAISAMKSKFPEIKATDIIKVINWTNFSTEQKFAFLNAIKNAFGSNEAVKAAQEAGIDIGKLVKEGMQSKDPEIRKQAEEWNKIINKGVTSPKPEVYPELAQSAASKITTGLMTLIQNLKPTVSADAKYRSGYPDNLVTRISNLSATVTAGANILQTTLDNLRNRIQGINPTINAEVKATGLDRFTSSLNVAAKNALKIRLKLPNGNNFEITPMATGGLVNSGDLFLANENGNAEMIGSFGNRTGVANQGQIIEGIRKGVSDANSEQNRLLQRQNEILLGILEKESSVRLSASAELGRVARQSLNMYGSMVGG